MLRGAMGMVAKLKQSTEKAAFINRCERQAAQHGRASSFCVQQNLRHDEVVSKDAPFFLQSPLCLGSSLVQEQCGHQPIALSNPSSVNMEGNLMEA